MDWMTSWPALVAVALVTVVAMEGFAWWAHRYIMHEWGWGWHRSHHEPHDEALEKNDLYAVVFGVLCVAIFFVGWYTHPAVRAFAWGITIYGVLYFIVHDGLVHQRWPFRYIPHRGYAKRLVQAHRLHHAVKGQADGVSFGFLYAPPIDRLHAQLRASGVIAREKADGAKVARSGRAADRFAPDEALGG